jgi:hypothetical protein
MCMLGERLMKEAERNVAITVKQSDARDAYETCRSRIEKV